MVCTGMVYRYFFGAWNHTDTSFWPTAIPVCRRTLNSCKIYCSLCSARKLVSWLSGKSLNLLCPRVVPRRKIYPKCICRPVLYPGVPDPAGGAYSTPLAGFEGPTSKGRGEKGGMEGKGWCTSLSSPGFAAHKLLKWLTDSTSVSYGKY